VCVPHDPQKGAVPSTTSLRSPLGPRAGDKKEGDCGGSLTRRLRRGPWACEYLETFSFNVRRRGLGRLTGPDDGLVAAYIIARPGSRRDCPIDLGQKECETERLLWIEYLHETRNFLFFFPTAG